MSYLLNAPYGAVFELDGNKLIRVDGELVETEEEPPGELYHQYNTQGKLDYGVADRSLGDTLHYWERESAWKGNIACGVFGYLRVYLDGVGSGGRVRVGGHRGRRRRGEAGTCATSSATCYIGIVGKQQYCSETVTLGNELGKRRGWGCFATVAGRREIAPRSATRADSPNDLPGRFSWVGVS